MTIRMFGIPNCDTVKKSRAWLESHGVDYAFHDYKKAGVDRVELRRWIDVHGWERILNRSGTTFRKLPDVDKADLDADKAIALMVAQPSMIRRPIVTAGDRTLVGFDPAAWDETLAS